MLKSMYWFIGSRYRFIGSNGKLLSLFSAKWIETNKKDRTTTTTTSTSIERMIELSLGPHDSRNSDECDTDAAYMITKLHLASNNSQLELILG